MRRDSSTRRRRSASWASRASSTGRSVDRNALVSFITTSRVRVCSFRPLDVAQTPWPTLIRAELKEMKVKIPDARPTAVTGSMLQSHPKTFDLVDTDDESWVLMRSDVGASWKVQEESSRSAGVRGGKSAGDGLAKTHACADGWSLAKHTATPKPKDDACCRGWPNMPNEAFEKTIMVDL